MIIFEMQRNNRNSVRQNGDELRRMIRKHLARYSSQTSVDKAIAELLWLSDCRCLFSYMGHPYPGAQNT